MLDGHLTAPEDASRLPLIGGSLFGLRLWRCDMLACSQAAFQAESNYELSG